MEKSLFKIYVAFFKVGTLLLGGGYVILPLLTCELANKRKWISEDELYEFYAISASLPGVIAVNTAIFTGRKLAGFMGALSAILGVITPAFLAIILLASILSEIVNISWVQKIFWGVGIGVITLLILAVREMWTKCVTDKFTAAVYSVCLILALSEKVSPAIIVILALLSGIVYQNLKKGET